MDLESATIRFVRDNLELLLGGEERLSGETARAVESSRADATFGDSGERGVGVR